MPNSDAQFDITDFSQRSGNKKPVSVQCLGPQAARAGNGSPRLCAVSSSLR
jgi:hypothetical protein